MFFDAMHRFMSNGAGVLQICAIHQATGLPPTDYFIGKIVCNLIVFCLMRSKFFGLNRHQCECQQDEAHERFTPCAWRENGFDLEAIDAAKQRPTIQSAFTGLQSQALTSQQVIADKLPALS